MAAVAHAATPKLPARTRLAKCCARDRHQTNSPPDHVTKLLCRANLHRMRSTTVVPCAAMSWWERPVASLILLPADCSSSSQYAELNSLLACMPPHANKHGILEQTVSMHRFTLAAASLVHKVGRLCAKETLQLTLMATMCSVYECDVTRCRQHVGHPSAYSQLMLADILRPGTRVELSMQNSIHTSQQSHHSTELWSNIPRSKPHTCGQFSATPFWLQACAGGLGEELTIFL